MKVYLRRYNGPVAQLGERLAGSEEASGAEPDWSTNIEGGIRQAGCGPAELDTAGYVRWSPG